MTRVLQAQVPLLALDGGTSQYFQEVFNRLVECCDANTAAIAALTLRVTANEAAIIALQAQITALALRVTANEAELADHELRIVALEP